jgi:unsaturated rhamnogalacturonyl hydrolase
MLWGFIRLFEKTGESRYLDYVLRYCEKHVTDDGKIPAFSGVSLDDIMAGSVLVWAFNYTNEDKYRRACEHIRRAFDDYPRNEDGGFWHGRNLPGEMWIDGLYMGLMFLTRYGALISDQEYCFQETVKQLVAGFECCEKDGSGLLYHAYSADCSTTWAHPITGKSPEVWCEGLGWYAMILTEVLDLMPESTTGYKQLTSQLQKLIFALEKLQDERSGLWLQVVDKPHHPRNWHDTSGSAMFLYAIEKARLLNLADTEQCKRIVNKAYSGIKTKCFFDVEGNINILDACDGLCVLDNYDAYVGYLRNINSKEAVAAFFWATQIVEYGI